MVAGREKEMGGRKEMFAGRLREFDDGEERVGRRRRVKRRI
jgi:hypothetical protein